MLKVSESYILGVDISDNSDIPVVTVTKCIGSKLTFIKQFSGDEALDIYKKITTDKRDNTTILNICKEIESITIDTMAKKINDALGIELYDWQKLYIFGFLGIPPAGRRNGKTLAYMIKLLLTDGEPINLYDRSELYRICDIYDDPRHNSIYPMWFKSELFKIYHALSKTDLKLRKINFEKETN